MQQIRKTGNTQITINISDYDKTICDIFNDFEMDSFK